MIDLDEVNAEIMRLENGPTTYASCEKLSTLYNVRNNSKQEPRQIEHYSYSAEPGSEFVRLMMKVPVEDSSSILDKHMELLQALYPREYNYIIDRLKELSEA